MRFASAPSAARMPRCHRDDQQSRGLGQPPRLQRLQRGWRRPALLCFAQSHASTPLWSRLPSDPRQTIGPLRPGHSGDSWSADRSGRPRSADGTDRADRPRDAWLPGGPSGARERVPFLGDPRESGVAPRTRDVRAHRPCRDGSAHRLILDVSVEVPVERRWSTIAPSRCRRRGCPASSHEDDHRCNRKPLHQMSHDVDVLRQTTALTSRCPCAATRYRADRSATRSLRHGGPAPSTPRPSRCTVDSTDRTRRGGSVPSPHRPRSARPARR
jgi:hypothetical protein